jgi:hypothetical protein
MTLYIVEKPSQVKALSGALKKAGLYSDDVVIKPLLGHILALKEFKDLDEDFRKKSWNELVRLNKVPFFPKNPYSIEMKKISNKKFFDEVKELDHLLSRGNKKRFVSLLSRLEKTIQIDKKTLTLKGIVCYLIICFKFKFKLIMGVFGTIAQLVRVHP